MSSKAVSSRPECKPSDEQPQHLQALARANSIRIDSANLYKELKALTRAEGLLQAAEWLEEPTETVLNCRLDRYLNAVTRFQSKKKTLCLQHARINPASLLRKVSELTERQRVELAACLRAQANP